MVTVMKMLVIYCLGDTQTGDDLVLTIGVLYSNTTVTIALYYP